MKGMNTKNPTSPNYVLYMWTGVYITSTYLYKCVKGITYTDAFWYRYLNFDQVIFVMLCKYNFWSVHIDLQIYSKWLKVANQMGVVVVLFLLVKILQEHLTTHSPPVLFFFFFWVKISLCILIPLFMPGSDHSGSSSWDDCGRCSLTSCVWACFRIGFPQNALIAAWSAHSNFTGSRMYACLGVTCHLHFCQNGRGLYVPLR